MPLKISMPKALQAAMHYSWQLDIAIGHLFPCQSTVNGEVQNALAPNKHHYVYNWHRERLIWGTFHDNERRLRSTSDISSSHLPAQRLNRPLGEGDACFAFHGLSLKLFPVFCLHYTHTRTRTHTHTHRARTCSDVRLKRTHTDTLWFTYTWADTHSQHRDRLLSFPMNF